MQIRLLLRVTLPQPVFDRAAVIALIAYQQRHKQAAYHAHRTRRLRLALLALPLATQTRIPATARPHSAHLPAALALPRDDHVSL